jgi:hypothetical protein
MSFLVTEELLERITTAVETSGEYEFTEQLDWVDKEGLVYAVVEKTIYVADKAHYNKKRANKISQKPG